MRNLSSGTERIVVFICDVCWSKKEVPASEVPSESDFPHCHRDYVQMGRAKGADGHDYSLIRHESHGPMSVFRTVDVVTNDFADIRSEKYDREAAHALAAVAKIEAMVRGEDVVG